MFQLVQYWQYSLNLWSQFLIMLTVSLHGILLHASVGLYPEEKIYGNDFETDVDIWLPDAQPWPFADYTFIRNIVADVFSRPCDLIETCVAEIHLRLKNEFPMAGKIRVCVKKLRPPMPGQVAYSMVCYEK
jgi:7,8-dihydroneopterin aldolase/epimerase/oxygenase